MSEISRSAETALSVKKIKMAYFSVFRMGFEQFFDSHMYNYIGKLKMIKWNRFDTDCKNKRAIFTRCISFTGPFVTFWEKRRDRTIIRKQGALFFKEFVKDVRFCLVICYENVIF